MPHIILHTARALLELVGIHPRSHKAIAGQFGLQWVQQRNFPGAYGRLLNSLYEDRDKADYGEYIPTFHDAVERTAKQVENFVKRARREIPPVSTAKMLSLLVESNPEIRDFSFNVYCPKSYFHHTRFTGWCPKGRLNDKWLRTLLNSTVKSLRALRIKNSQLYVIGLNSRVNQYEPKHILMLDLDDMSTLPKDKFRNEPGFFFRTGSGYHFIGARLYDFGEWKRKRDLTCHWPRKDIMSFQSNADMRPCVLHHLRENPLLPCTLVVRRKDAIRRLTNVEHRHCDSDTSTGLGDDGRLQSIVLSFPACRLGVVRVA